MSLLVSRQSMGASATCTHNAHSAQRLPKQVLGIKAYETTQARQSTSVMTVEIQGPEDGGADAWR